MATLQNPSFEGITRPGGWTRQTHDGQEWGEIYVPEGWTAWWREGTFRRPEMKVIQNVPPFDDPPRIHEGDWAFQAFTMYGRQHAGLYQVVAGLLPGETYELAAWAHAWSLQPGIGEQSPYCSSGVGYGAVCIPEGSAPEVDPDNPDPIKDAIGNFTFRVGVSYGDPDPEAVDWGSGAHIYNAYHEVPPLRFIAPDDGKVTIYLCATSLWEFKNSDSYWDSVTLKKVGAHSPPKDRGQPRIQYARTYTLLHPEADAEWANMVVAAAWDTRRYTIGGSADDAGIGDLDHRRVIIIRPGQWPGGETGIREFYEQYYPDVDLVMIPGSIDAVRNQLVELVENDNYPFEPGSVGPDPSPPEPPIFTLRGVHDLAGADWLLASHLQGWCTEACYIGTDPRQLDLGRYAGAGIRVILRLTYSYAQDDGGAGTMPSPHELQAHEDAVVETMRLNPDAWGFVYGNEPNNQREWPRGYSLTPEYYLVSYNRVWAAKPSGARLSPCAIDPYNAGWGDWRKSWYEVLRQIAGASFLALHAYTHGSDLALIWSKRVFGDDPLRGVYYDMRVLESQQDIVPARFWGMPNVVTETNHWVKRNGAIGWDPDTGAWVSEAYRYFASHGVAGACPFRHGYRDWNYSGLPAVLGALRDIR